MSFNASAALAELEAVLGPIEDFFAKHTTGKTQVIALTAEEFTPMLGAIVNGLINAHANNVTVAPPAQATPATPPAP